MYFGLIILALIGILFFSIGISAYKSKEPASFWNVKPPVTKNEISNVNACNKAYAILFIICGIAWVLCGFSFLLELSWYIYLMEIFIPVIISTLLYTLIYKKYKRQ